MKKLAIAMATSMVVAASPGYAAPLLFDFSGTTIGGPVTAIFQLDSNPIPDATNAPGSFGIKQIFFNNVAGVFNGNSQTATTIAFGQGAASQFQILGTSAGFAQFGGQNVFTGTVNNPVFSVGTFTFTGFSSGTLTVSNVVAGAVPEPATWAMMLIGFGGIGFAMRRKTKVQATASYA